MNQTITHFSFDKQPNDQTVRDEVVNPAQSFILQAPAGSGKTELLVNRFIHLLSVVNEPEEIVAITFTKKAASEMVYRVVDRLRLAQSSPEKLTKDVFDICQKVLIRDEQRNWGLMENTHRLSIQTIDSFCLKIASQLPWTTGLGESPKVDIRANELYQQAVGQLMDVAFHKQSQHGYDKSTLTNLSDAISTLLIHHNYHLSSLNELLVGFLAKRDQWLKVIFQFDTLDEARLKLEASWQQLIIHELNASLKQLEGILTPNLGEVLQFAANNLYDTGVISDFVTCFKDDKSLPSVDLADVTKWRALASFITNNTDAPLKRYTISNGIPTGAKSEKALLATIYDYLNETPSALEAIVRLKKLPPSSYSDESWQQISALYTVLKHCALELITVFKHQGVVDNSEITSRVIDALSTNASQTALKLDYQIQHILVDEFQDTSTTQLHLLSVLTQEWYQGDNRSLFLVGDPMQSIYRFRGANVAGFMNIFEHGLDNINIQPRHLQTNFRSSKTVVEWINEHFPFVFSAPSVAANNRLLGDVSYSPSDTFRDNNQLSAVNCHRVEEPYRQNESDKIVDLIEAYIEQSETDDRSHHIAVLIQNRTHSHYVIDALNRANIASSNIKIKPLTTLQSILDIASLTKAFLHFGDEIAWLSLLRAPWCGLDMSDITILLDTHKSQTIWQSIQQAITDSSLNVESLKRLQHLHDSIFHYIYRHDISLSQRIRECWQHIYGLKNFSHSKIDNTIVFSKSESESIELYLKHLSIEEASGNVFEASHIDELLKTLYAVDNNTHKSHNQKTYHIEVMTVHNAKGLQFDQVIIPGLSAQAKTSSAEPLSWFEYYDTSDNQNNMINLVSGFKDDKVADTVSRQTYINDKKNQASRFEKARLLYVACTRAVNRLDLILYDDKSPKNSLTALLNQSPTFMPSDKETSGDHGSNKKTQAKPENSSGRLNVSNTLYRLDESYLSLISPPNLANTVIKKPPVSFQWAGLNARIIGILLHEYLCDCANHRHGLGEVPKSLTHYWQKQLQSNGLFEHDCRSVITKLETIVYGMKEDDKLNWILSATHQDSHNEWPLTYVHSDGDQLLAQKHIIIDRSFIEHNTRWIIDYKSGNHEGGNLEDFLANEKARYFDAMAAYGKAVSSYDHHQYPIKLGLYFPLIKAWKTWDYQP